jgi:hypothetical protein
MRALILLKYPNLSEWLNASQLQKKNGCRTIQHRSRRIFNRAEIAAVIS